VNVFARRVRGAGVGERHRRCWPNSPDCGLKLIPTAFFLPAYGLFRLASIALFRGKMEA